MAQDVYKNIQTRKRFHSPFAICAKTSMYMQVHMDPSSSGSFLTVVTTTVLVSSFLVEGSEVVTEVELAVLPASGIVDNVIPRDTLAVAEVELGILLVDGKVELGTETFDIVPDPVVGVAGSVVGDDVVRLCVVGLDVVGFSVVGVSVVGMVVVGLSVVGGEVVVGSSVVVVSGVADAFHLRGTSRIYLHDTGAGNL